MQNRVLKADASLDRRQILGAGDKVRLGIFSGVLSLGGLPLNVRPLKCIVYAAHISRSFSESVPSATGVMLLSILVCRVRFINTCIAGNEIMKGCSARSSSRPTDSTMCAGIGLTS